MADLKQLLSLSATFDERAAFEKDTDILSIRKLAECPHEIRSLFPSNVADRFPRHDPEESTIRDVTPKIVTLAESVYETGTDVLEGDLGYLTGGGAQGYGEDSFRIMSVRETAGGERLHLGWFDNLEWGEWRAGKQVRMKLPEREEKRQRDRDARNDELDREATEKERVFDSIMADTATIEEKATWEYSVNISAIRKLEDLPSETKALFPSNVAERMPAEPFDESWPCDYTPTVLTFEPSVFQPGSDVETGVLGTLTAPLWTVRGKIRRTPTFRIMSVRETDDGERLHLGWFDGFFEPWMVDQPYMYRMRLLEYDDVQDLAKKRQNWDEDY